MSKRVEILNIRLDQLNNELNNIELRVNKLRNRQNQEQTRILEKYFGDGFEGFVLDIGRERVSVKSDKGNWSVVDFYIYNSYSSKNEEQFTKIEMSTSSYRPEILDESVVDRFKMLAYYSKLVVDFQDDIIAEFNTNASKYNKLQDSFYEKSRELRRAIRSQEDDIANLEKESYLEKLFSEDGITLTTTEDDKYLPNLQVKFNWRMGDVSKLKGIKKSASGKSIDLEVTTRSRDWSTNKYSFRTTEVDRVRFENIETFLRKYKKMIA